MQLSYSALILVALGLDGVLASPARHRHSHAKRVDVDWKDPSNYKGVDWNTVDYSAKPTSAPASVPENKAAVAAPVSSSAPAVSSAPTPVQSSPPQSSPSQATSGGDSTTGFGGRTDPKEDGVDADRVGNLGIPYGSNMKKISESDVANYKYTNVISNTQSAPITVIVWNKACPDGKVAGWSCPNMKLEIPAGGKQAMAFDEDTQGGLSLNCGTDPTRGGVPNCAWGEFDFGNIHNKGWSGYDRSSIPVGGNGVAGELTMSSQSGVVSSAKENSFTDVSQTNAGGALVAGPAHLTTQF